MASKDKNTGEVIRRSFMPTRLSAELINVEERTAWLSFASSYAVERGNGFEVLDMAGLNFERVNAGGMALLFGHQPLDQIGVVLEGRVDGDGVARALVKFSRSQRGQEFFQDVQDGIRTLVSVGYTHDEVVLTHEDETSRTFTVKRWTPHEISLVSIPADPTVGVGRSLPTPSAPAEEQPTAEKLPVQVRSAAQNNNKENKMADQDPAVIERARALELTNLGVKYKADAIAREFIENGKSVAEFCVAVLERKPDPAAVRNAKLGMTDKETATYNVFRALNAASTGDWSKAGFEREVSDAAIKANGGESRGKNSFRIAGDVLNARAASDQTVGVKADGGYFVQTQQRTEDFITKLQNATVMSKLNPTVLKDVSKGRIEIPVETGLMGVQVVGEDVDAQATKFALDQLAINPCSIVSKVTLSRYLMNQSSIPMQAYVIDRFAKAFALKIDQLAFTGSGVGVVPKGILVAMQAAQKLVVGTDLTWAEVVALETMVSSANADGGSLAYVGNSKTRGYLKTHEKAAGTAQFMWTDSAPGVGMVNGYAAHVTNHLEGALPLVYGDFSNFIQAYWSGLDFAMDPIADNGSQTIKVFQDYGQGIAHIEGFAAAFEA